MKLLGGFNGLWIGLLVTVLRGKGVLGDCTVEGVGKHTSEEYKFDMIREVTMFLQEIMYFLEQAEWITKEDVEHMLKILENYKKRTQYEIYNKSVQLEVTKETLETNEYRKMVNEFRIFVSKEKEMDESGLRGNSSRDKEGDERMLEKDMGSGNGNSGSSRTLSEPESEAETQTETETETDKDENGVKPQQVELEESTSRRQYGCLSPIDEKLKETGTGTEVEVEDEEITRYEYELDTPELFQEEFEELDVLPLREVNRFKDKIDKIQGEIHTLEARLKEVMRIEGIVKNLKEQIDAYLRIQEGSEVNEEFGELEIEPITIND